MQTLQTTFDLKMLPFQLQDFHVWHLACTGEWKRDRSKRTASFGVGLRCPRTGTSALVVRLSTEEFLLELHLADIWSLAPLNTWIPTSFRDWPFTPRALLSPLYTTQAFVRLTSLTFTNRCKYHLLDFMWCSRGVPACHSYQCTPCWHYNS